MRRTKKAKAEAPPSPPAPPRRGDEHPGPSTRFEILERKQNALNLLQTGLTKSAARDILVSEMGITEGQADYAIDAVLRDQVAEYEEMLPKAKALQVMRLRGLAARAWAKDKLSTAVQAETLISKILGTQAPLKVRIDADVTVKESLLAVVANLTPEERDEMLHEQLELERTRERRILDA